MSDDEAYTEEYWNANPPVFKVQGMPYFWVTVRKSGDEFAVWTELVNRNTKIMPTKKSTHGSRSQAIQQANKLATRFGLMTEIITRFRHPEKYNQIDVPDPLKNTRSGCLIKQNDKWLIVSEDGTKIGQFDSDVAAEMWWRYFTSPNSTELQRRADNTHDKIKTYGPLKNTKKTHRR